MTLSPAQKKLLHTVIGMAGASGGYIGVNALPLPPSLKVPLLGLCVGVIIRGAGWLLAKIDTEPAKP